MWVGDKETGADVSIFILRVAVSKVFLRRHHFDRVLVCFQIETGHCFAALRVCSAQESSGRGAKRARKALRVDLLMRGMGLASALAGVVTSLRLRLRFVTTPAFPGSPCLGKETFVYLDSLFSSAKINGLDVIALQK